MSIFLILLIAPPTAGSALLVTAGESSSRSAELAEHSHPGRYTQAHSTVAAALAERHRNPAVFGGTAVHHSFHQHDRPGTPHSAPPGWQRTRSVHPLRVVPKAACGIIWFYHVPKCGGSSVSVWLQNLRREGYLEYVYPLWGNFPETIDFETFFSKKIEPFLEDPFGRLIAVHHHNRGPGLANGTAPPWALMKQRLEARGCKLIRFTILRDPVERLKSLLQFSSAHHQPKQEWRSVLERARGGEVDNGIIRYILYNQRSAYPNDHPLDRPVTNSTLDEAIIALGQFEHVGKLETIESDLGKVAKLAAIPNSEGRHIMPSNLSPSMLGHEFSDLLPLIEAHVAMDLNLYRHFFDGVMATR